MMGMLKAADDPELKLEMEAMQRTTASYCDEWNRRHQQLLDNDRYLKSAVDGKGEFTAEDKKKLDGIEEGANQTIVDTDLDKESENPIRNAVVAASLDALTKEIEAIKKLFPNLAAPTAADAGKVVKIDGDGNAVWAEDYGSSPQAKYPDFYAQDYDVDITDRKRIETVYEDGHRAVVDIADGGDITQTLYDAGGVLTAQRKTTFSDDKNHITERKVDVNELGESDMDS